MDVIIILWIILQVAAGYNLVLPLLLFFFWKIKRKPEISPEKTLGSEADYAIIVTAYQQTDTLPAVVSSLLSLNYSNYMIYIVADNCDISSLNFDNPKIIVLRPEEILASNTRSHFYAIERFKRRHERLTIIDSDNLADPDYLTELNVFFDKGFKAVQGLRAAKNLDTTFSCLDAARDIYYHFYDGVLLYELGSSATLSGSGMAFDTALYTTLLGSLDITGAGFDKVLQAAIVKKGLRIAFAEKAVVFDEKTSRPAQLVNQRSRWINTWFRYCKFGYQILLKGIKKMSVNQFLFGIILLRPPLFLFILTSVLCSVMDIFLMPAAVPVWATAFVLFIAGFAIALASSNTDKRIYKSLVNIPRFMALQVYSLLKARSANKRSVATTHYHFSSPDSRLISKENEN